MAELPGAPDTFGPAHESDGCLVACPADVALDDRAGLPAHRRESVRTRAPALQTSVSICMTAKAATICA